MEAIVGEGKSVEEAAAAQPPRSTESPIDSASQLTVITEDAQVRPERLDAARLKPVLKAIKVLATLGFLLAVVEVSLNISCFSRSIIWFHFGWISGLPDYFRVPYTHLTSVGNNTNNSNIFNATASQVRLNPEHLTTPGIWSGIPGLLLCACMLAFSHLSCKRGFTRNVIIFGYVLAASSVLTMGTAIGAGYYAANFTIEMKGYCSYATEDLAPTLCAWSRLYLAITVLCFLQVLIRSSFFILISAVHCLASKSCDRVIPSRIGSGPFVTLTRVFATRRTDTDRRTTNSARYSQLQEDVDNNKSPQEAGTAQPVEPTQSNDDSAAQQTVTAEDAEASPARLDAAFLKPILMAIKVVAALGILLAVVEVSLNISCLSRTANQSFWYADSQDHLYFRWTQGQVDIFSHQISLRLSGWTTPGIWAGSPGMALFTAMVIFSHLAGKRGFTRCLIIFGYVLATSSILMMGTAAGAMYSAANVTLATRGNWLWLSEDEAPTFVTWSHLYLAITVLCFLQVLISSSLFTLLGIIPCLARKSCDRVLPTRIGPFSLATPPNVSASRQRETVGVRLGDPGVGVLSAASQSPHGSERISQEDAATRSTPV